MCTVCEIEGKDGTECKMRSYRETIQEPGMHIGFMINELKFNDQVEVLVKTFSILLFYIRRNEPEREKEFCEHILKGAKLGANVLIKMKDDFKDLPKETCVVCDSEFLSDGSNEVPVCPSCLMTAGRPKAPQGKE